MVFVVNEYARLAAITLDGTPKIAWQDDEELSDVASPLATKDFVFVATSYGTVSCYDSKSGENYWIEEFDKGFYSSPILVGENVYLMDMSGLMYIFKAAKEYQPVAQNELGEGAVAIPAFMHNRIYIRGNKHLYCIGNN